MGLILLVDFSGLFTVNLMFYHIENSFNVLLGCAHTSDDASVSYLVFLREMLLEKE